ncbi:MAG: AAC(3) family N-acetyltransferase [Promethearchaeota archaeon]|nr:MAG: AAC(3) family N-acetyltransferase [Candidatus Lokiarchaeota archaeon]
MKEILKEKEVVNNTPHPNTKSSLKRDLKKLGLTKGDIIILHSSLSKIGWTIGGPVAIIKALMETLTSKGTIIMPTFSSDNSEPSRWENPPVPREWWSLIRKFMPEYNPKYTPTRGVGIIPEVFRKFPNVLRSDHPMASFAAWGYHAREIVEDHSLEADLGEGSPLSKIYDLNGNILLLGVGHLNNTSLHLAEYRSYYEKKEFRDTGSAISIDNKRKWVIWKELNHNSDDFSEIGSDYEKKIGYISKKVGLATSRLLNQKDLIDFAIDWMKKNR